MMSFAPIASRVAIAFGAMLLLAASGASAQKGPVAQKAPAPPPQATTSEPTAAPDPAPEAKPETPGLLNELGKLFVKPSDLFPSFKSSSNPAVETSPLTVQPGDSGIGAPSTATAPAVATPSVPSAAAATAPAAPKLPTPGLVLQVVNGRTPCPISANGAPDCKAGADKLCQDKGFAGGRSLDMDTAHKCSTKALLAGARTIKDICRTENFVTRAMCQ